MNRDETLRIVNEWKSQGLVVGFTNGCFDIVHAGHISLLEDAKAQCDRLVVALNDDESVRALKGPTRPINTLNNRVRVMEAIKHVDHVTVFGESTPLELIALLLPDVLIKGSDYSVETVVGSGVVLAAGGKVHLAQLIPGQSTTAILARGK